MNDAFARIDAAATAALADELALDPKPGLVTPHSSGSHDDMDARHFTASIAALTGYFGDCARLTATGAGFAVLRERGVQAEAAMLAATGGINTHRGAIFTLGLLAAASGVATRDAHRPAVDDLGDIVFRHWSEAILAAGRHAPPSHGRRVRAALGLPGAREHAAGGLPVLFDVTLPALRLARARLGDVPAAALHALISTVAQLSDTTLAHRGGLAGLVRARHAANRFLAEGSVFAPDWPTRIAAISDEFVAHRLSPGGSADLLAAAIMLLRIEQDAATRIAPSEALTA